MEGLGEIRGSWDNDPNAGIIPRALSDLFDGLRVADATEFSVRVSFLELYNEEIFDLLSSTDDQTKLRLYEDIQKKGSVIIQGLEEVQVQDKHEVFKILERGSIKRQTAETKMNASSSRSHTIFTATVFINQQSLEGEDMLRIGKLNLVDLAGSENVGRSGAVNQRAREAGNINQSLLTLGRVIVSLVDRTPHVPYRESKLTRLLQDSLGGRTKTSIIATISPASVNHEETLSTLDYAHRAKNITNKPEVNQKISKKEKLLEYHHEIDKLKTELQAAREKDGVFLPKDAYEEQIKARANQDEEIVALTKELQAKEIQLDEFLEMFNDTKARLEKTTEERDKNIRALNCTRSVLHKTENDKRQEEYLKQKHHETEKKVTQQAKVLLEASVKSTKDLSRVHDKLDRIRNIDRSNDKVKEQFITDCEETHTCLTNTIKKCVDNQLTSSQIIEAANVKNIETRNEVTTKISSDYGKTLSKLIETFGNIGKLVSLNNKADQEWITEAMEKTKSEADIRSNEFQNYLADTLLLAASEILAAVAKQNDIIENLSSKIDNNVTELDQKLNVFLENQETHRNSKFEEDSNVFIEMAKLNEVERQNIEHEKRAIDNRRRRECEFFEKINNLLKEKQYEEEQYEEKRKEMLDSSVKNIASYDQLVKKAKILRTEENHKAKELDTNYQKQQTKLIGRINDEKKEALNTTKGFSDMIINSTEALKKGSEEFVMSGKVRINRIVYYRG